MEYLRKLDRMTNPVGLNVDRHRAQQSLPGAFASLLYYCSCIFFFVRLGILYLDRKNPSLNYVVSQMEERPRIDMVANKLLPIVYFARNTTIRKSFGDDYLVQIRRRKIVDTVIKDEYYPLIACKQLLEKTDYFEGVQLSSYHRSILNYQALCVDILNETIREELYISGGFGDDSYNAIILSIRSKKPLTVPPFDSPEAQTFRGIHLLTILPSLQTDDHQNPVNFTAKEERFRLKNDTFTYLQKVVHKKVLEDYYGWPFSSQNRATVYESTNDYVFQIKKDTTQKLIWETRFEIKIDKTTITRNYSTLMDIAGTFGGIHDILKLIISTLFLLLYRPTNRSIADKVFKLDSHQQVHEALDVPQDIAAVPKKNRFWVCVDAIRCRKKSGTLLDRKLAAAKGLIEHNLDALTIVKKLNLVTLMSEVLFSRKDLALIQAASLALYQTEEKQRQAQKSAGVEPKENIVISKITRIEESGPKERHKLRRSDAIVSEGLPSNYEPSKLAQPKEATQPVTDPNSQQIQRSAEVTPPNKLTAQQSASQEHTEFDAIQVPDEATQSGTAGLGR